MSSSKIQNIYRGTKLAPLCEIQRIDASIERGRRRLAFHVQKSQQLGELSPVRILILFLLDTIKATFALVAVSTPMWFPWHGNTVQPQLEFGIRQHSGFYISEEVVSTVIKSSQPEEERVTPPPPSVPGRVGGGLRGIRGF